MKTCPDCAEEVQDAAHVCRYCGYRFDAGASAVGAQPPPETSPQAAYSPQGRAGRRSIAPIVLAALALIGAGAGAWYLSTDDDRQEAAGRDAKASARTAQTAIETYAVDRNGAYEGATAEGLQAIEPTLPDDLEVVAGFDTYTVTVPSGNASFSISREGGLGGTMYTCEPPGEGECPLSGEWDGY